MVGRSVSDGAIPEPVWHLSRVLQDLDTDESRVCDQSRDFILSIMDKPVLDLSNLAPALVERSQVLRFAREKRRQVIAILQKLHEETNAHLQQHLEEIISDSVGLNRTYLCISDSLYSLRDLLGIRDGECVRNLIKIEKKLLKFDNSTEY